MGLGQGHAHLQIFMVSHSWFSQRTSLSCSVKDQAMLKMGLLTEGSGLQHVSAQV